MRYVSRRHVHLNLTVIMEEWDTYLAEYASSLPISRGRAGTFRPLSHSVWDRLFPWMHKSKQPIASDFLLPPDSKHSPAPLLSSDYHQRTEWPTAKPAFTLDDSPRLLRRQSQPPLARLRGLRNAGSHGYRKREAVKFGVVNPDDSSSDDDDDPLSTLPPRPARRTSTLSSVTLTNGSTTGSRGFPSIKEDQENVVSAKRAALRGKDGGDGDGAPEYSDHEEDVTDAQAPTGEHDRDSPSWRPPFLTRHGSNAAKPVSPPAGTVPMTPSLIRAVDRIAAAQAQAYGPSAAAGSDSSAATPYGRSETGVAKKQRWEAFWRDVTARAAESTNVR